MAAYRADIEIAVRGAQELKKLQTDIRTAADLVDSLNSYLQLFGSGQTVRSINNLRNAVSDAAEVFNRAALGTEEATVAANQYIQATDKLNAGLKERSALLEKINRQERASALVRAGVGAPSKQLLLPAAAPGAPAMSGGARRRITGPVERLGGARTSDEAAAALRLAQNIKQQVAPLSQVEALYAGIAGEAAKLQRIKALPDSSMLNAAVRGLQRLETAEDKLNGERAETAARLREIDRLEEGRERRARKLADRAAYEAGAPAPSLTAATSQGPSRLANIALGAGFPLLFGGGPGAVLGGAAGGFVPGPGGFAAQIALSAIGTQFDKFGQQAMEMGTALTSTASTLELMREKSLFSSNAIAERAYQLEEQGKVEELAALLTEDLARAVGNEGVRALQELGSETTETTRLWNLLTAQLNALIAGPLTSFLKLVNQLLGEITAGQQIASLKQDLAPADLKRLQQRERQLGTAQQGRLASELGTANIVLSPKAQQQLLKEFGPLRKTPPPGTITQQDRRDITAPKAKKDTAAERAAREAEREAARVEKALRLRELSSLQLQRQFDITQKIFAAESAKDTVLARELNGEYELVRIGIETARALEEEKNSRVQLAIAKDMSLKRDLAILKTQLDVTEIVEKRAEKFNEIITDLDHELQLRGATTQAERDRLTIEYEMQKLRKDKVFDETQLLAIEERKAQLAKPVTGAEFIKQQVGSLSDELNKIIEVGNQVTVVAETVGVSFAESFKGVITGAMSAQQALANFFQRIADSFLDMAAQIIAKMIQIQILNAALGIFGRGGAAGAVSSDPVSQFLSGVAQYRAEGGSVMGGSPYIVGERGPELFVPGRSGTIVPNNQLGAGGATSVTVNVDASGSNVEGNDQGANQLGKVIGLAVQQELIKQKRPGGLLAGV